MDQDGAMRRLADCAHQVSNAAGVAIGLLEGDQLVYRAGSGTAATCVGRRVAATLVASQALHRPREILHVENVETSKSVEAAVCRQFGAHALLILPVYQDSATVGVMEIHFSETHAFLEHEVRTYRLMAGLVGEAVTRAAGGEVSDNPLGAVSPAIEHLAFQIKKIRTDARPAPKAPAKQAPAKQVIEPVKVQAVKPAETVSLPKRRAQAATSKRQPWSGFSRMSFLAGLEVPAVAATLIAVLGIAYSVGRPALPKQPVAQPMSSVSDQPPAAASAQLVPASVVSKPQAPAGTVQRTKTVQTKFHRMPAAKGNVKYVGDDVTIRYFTAKTTPPGTRGAERVQVRDDVTVRHFPVKPGLALSAKSSPGAAQAASGSLEGLDKTGVSKPER
jgi:putative methionine-R-sulfoxide reductase with GAF domain